MLFKYLSFETKSEVLLELKVGFIVYLYDSKLSNG